MVAQFDFVKSCESTDGKSSIEDFLVKAIENKCEGLMFKVVHYCCKILLMFLILIPITGIGQSER